MGLLSAKLGADFLLGRLPHVAIRAARDATRRALSFIPQAVGAWRAKLVLDQLSYMEAELASTPTEDVAIIQYESICGAPNAVAKRLAGFLQPGVDEAALVRQAEKSIHPCKPAKPPHLLPDDEPAARAMFEDAKRRRPRLLGNLDVERAASNIAR